MKVDKKDKQLLTLLYLNSRASFTELGKSLKLSSSSVERRLRQLEESGVISLLFADVNLAKLGYKGYRLYFKFDVLDQKTEQEILKLFETYPRTLWGVIAEGQYDVLWRVIAKNEIEVEQAAAIMIEKFGSKIIEKTIVTTIYQTYLAWNKALDTHRYPEMPMEKITEVEKIDQVDLKLLSALYTNSRESTVNLAKLVGLTPDAVHYRIKKLIEREFILGYTAWFDAKKLGFNYYKILIGFRNITKEKEHEFVKFCTENDHIIFLNKSGCALIPTFSKVGS
ncbi:AsnC family transcriptional regulator [Candidatus Micrarchaeota archaeon]|nr:AsnC family transcriptional regulator [Candidatus Micrarchaeota archaeon]